MSEYLENALAILSEMAEAKKMKGKDPCWDGYEMVGTKKKNGKEVPNCVPKNEEVELEEAQLAHKVMYAMKDPKKGGKIAVAHYEKEEDAKKFLDDIKKKGGHGIIRKNEPKNEETELNQIFTEAMKKDEESSNKKVIKKGEQLSGKQEVVKVNPEIPNRN